jgi:hypothetical protein
VSALEVAAQLDLRDLVEPVLNDVQQPAAQQDAVATWHRGSSNAISRVTPVLARTVNSLPVLLCTTISRRPAGSASMPFTLVCPATNWMSPLSGPRTARRASRPARYQTP